MGQYNPPTNLDKDVINKGKPKNNLTMLIALLVKITGGDKS